MPKKTKPGWEKISVEIHMEILSRWIIPEKKLTEK